MSIHSIARTLCIIGPFPEDTSHVGGGVQAAVYGQAKALAALPGMTLQIIALPSIGSPTKAHRHRQVEGLGVLYLRTHKRQSASALDVPFILHNLPDRTSCVVHIHGTGLAQALLIALLRLKRIRHVWTLHGITEKETRQRYRTHKTPANLARYVLYTLLERFCTRAASHIVVDTPYVAAEITRKSDISVIPCGALQMAGLEHSTPDANLPLIVSIGVIKPRKGHHLTIEAFAKVKQQVPQATLVIAGASPDMRYLGKLKERVLHLGLADSVSFRINLTQDEIQKLLLHAKLFALHSQEESQGIALCEAMAAGLPIVATHVGGIPYVVEHAKDGLLADYGDVEGFAASMTQLLQDASLYEKMSHAARISSRRFDWKNLTDEFTAVYSKIR